MEILVLVKVVPDADALSADPATGTARRAGVDLFVNPFDQRALRVALDVRRAGESVTVLSIGPPSAEKALHETRALGADRAILLTDPALAGSDTLVTARVLHRAVQGLAAGLILMGTWSTDSETGQVPPQLAELLDWPFVAGARRLVRAPDDGLEIDADTEDGWISYGTRAPAVVSVGEKITKIRKLLPEEARAATELPVELWPLSRLALSADAVGLRGSPTRVVRLLEEAPGRVPQIFDQGTPAERVARAVARLSELLVEGAPAGGMAEPPPGPTAVAGGRFLVLITGADGRRAPFAVDLVAGLRRPYPRSAIETVEVGEAPGPEALGALGPWGVARAWSASTDDRPVTSEAAAEALRRAAGKGDEPAGILLLSDRFGRAVAGRLAAHEGWGLTGDATGIERGADGRPLYRKPAFGGRWIAEIATRSGPAVATVRPGAFPPGPRAVREPPPVESIALSPHPPRVRAIGGGVERDAGWGEPLSAGLVFVAGQGVEGPEGVFAVRDAARSLGGALGATRRVVDLGWAPRQVQVGLTGIAPEPKVAVLVGVSGSTNHMVGLRRARAIVAVNHDATAPVFQRADIGLVGDWKELLPLLRDALSATLPEILDRAP